MPVNSSSPSIAQNKPRDRSRASTSVLRAVRVQCTHARTSAVNMRNETNVTRRGESVNTDAHTTNFTFALSGNPSPVAHFDAICPRFLTIRASFLGGFHRPTSLLLTLLSLPPEPIDAVFFVFFFSFHCSSVYFVTRFDGTVARRIDPRNFRAARKLWLMVINGLFVFVLLVARW